MPRGQDDKGDDSAPAEPPERAILAAATREERQPDEQERCGERQIADHRHLRAKLAPSADSEPNAYRPLRAS